MKRFVAIAALLVGCSALTAVSDGEQASNAVGLRLAIEKLRPLHQKIGKPGPNDWLAHHDESGQTFEQYVRSRPVTPQGARNVLYIQPIGAFSKTQRKIMMLTAEYMQQYFSLEVKTNEAIPLSAIPDAARRVHPAWGDKQILTTYVLDNVLSARLPKNAAAMIAFTASDLWPGEGWNFVFGQASIRRRVGVWSIYRNGDPDKDEQSFKLCLARTIKTAVHETSHMFSMYHCTAYECCMCGSNHQEESDRRPLHLCPECVAKVCWATQADPVARYKRLVEF
ncbi:MAG: archaemetzincin, partial [Verrucomicrobia bacterium]|nr:archaemetzincin [Verrucomicrobiota bacterium]